MSLDNRTNPIDYQGHMVFCGNQPPLCCILVCDCVVCKSVYGTSGQIVIPQAPRSAVMSAVVALQRVSVVEAPGEILLPTDRLPYLLLCCLPVMSYELDSRSLYRLYAATIATVGAFFRSLTRSDQLWSFPSRFSIVSGTSFPFFNRSGTASVDPKSFRLNCVETRCGGGDEVLFAIDGFQASW